MTGLDWLWRTTLPLELSKAVEFDAYHGFLEPVLVNFLLVVYLYTNWLLRLMYFISIIICLVPVFVRAYIYLIV